MDEHRFDQLSRRFATFRTRRQALKAFAGAVIGVATGARGVAAQDCTPHYSPCGSDEQCCAGAACEYGLCMPGCRIDGAFVTASAMPPGDICRRCAPEQSTTSWTPANEGISCWSGDPTAGLTTCQSGTCAPVAPQSCPPPTPCHLEGQVDPVTGMCVNRPAPAGTPCGGTAMCFGEFYQPADTCDGAGFCIAGGSQVVSCAPGRCGEGACVADCASDRDCASGAHCDGAQCVMNEDLGYPCDEDSDCRSGLCTNGVCCDQRCESRCDTCSAQTGGRCSPIVCDSGNPCIIDACDPDVGCVQTMKIAGSSCDDGNPCDGNEVCDGAGHCTEGTPVVCTASDQCHGVGVCDPATGACSNPALPDGTPCSAGNRCVTGDACQAGVCVSGQQAIACDSGNPCIIDSCDPAVGCVHAFTIEGASCDDGNPCNGDEICDGAGNCVEGTPITCQPPDQCHGAGVCDPEAGVCSYAELPNGTPCNDGTDCTVNDVCEDGRCRGTLRNLSIDSRHCGMCGNDCRNVGSINCQNGRCCTSFYPVLLEMVCCTPGLRPSICDGPDLSCGYIDCNCYYEDYSCGLFGLETCTRTVCDKCIQSCTHGCCV